MHWELRFTPVPASPATARHAVARWLWDAGTPAEQILDATLAASELVTDAIVLEAGGDIVLRTAETGGTVFIDVETVPPVEIDPFALMDSATKDRLSIVTAVAANVSIRKERSGHHHLTCTIPVSL